MKVAKNDARYLKADQSENDVQNMTNKRNSLPPDGTSRRENLNQTMPIFQLRKASEAHLPSLPFKQDTQEKQKIPLEIDAGADLNLSEKDEGPRITGR